MFYKTYREKGILIGSGHVEADHRIDIQQRLKLSGRQWKVKGGNAIPNLRFFNKSGAWHIVKKILMPLKSAICYAHK